jgi:hypothetical protein
LNLKLDLAALEKQYQMTSKEFYQQFSQGILGDESDLIIWSGLRNVESCNKTLH